MFLMKMAGKKRRKNKVNPHHQFLYSWDQKPASGARVKREAKIEAKRELALPSAKKDIVRSLIIASLILSLELVLYLGRNRIMP
jgi:hypothetical protein